MGKSYQGYVYEFDGMKLTHYKFKLSGMTDTHLRGVIILIAALPIPTKDLPSYKTMMIFEGNIFIF